MTSTSIDDQIKEAELQKIKAEVRKLNEETEHEDIRGTRALLGLETDIRQKRSSKFSAWNQGIYYFNFGVDRVAVESLRGFLHYHDFTWENDDTELDQQRLTIVINSHGGSIFDGLDAGDCIMEMRDKGWHITTKVAGMAASMAGVLLQFGTERVIGRNSWLHLHEASKGVIGKTHEIADTAELSRSLTRQMCEIYVDRSKGVAAEGDQWTVDELYAWIERFERWITPTDALKYGFCDRIG